jgi:hypothetical protein
MDGDVGKSRGVTFRMVFEYTVSEFLLRIFDESLGDEVSDEEVHQAKDERENRYTEYGVGRPSTDTV